MPKKKYNRDNLHVFGPSLKYLVKAHSLFLEELKPNGFFKVALFRVRWLLFFYVYYLFL